MDQIKRYLAATENRDKPNGLLRKRQAAHSQGPSLMVVANDVMAGPPVSSTIQPTAGRRTAVILPTHYFGGVAGQFSKRFCASDNWSGVILASSSRIFVSARSAPLR